MGGTNIKYTDEEKNYNVRETKPNEKEEMRQSIKLFKEELIEIIRTYLNPWLK